ncbi:hypothetical protein BGZ65_007915 [Modicella reniformis]|uniref:WD40 repeat-like protein n=1 Tax=Modicella reniformis TaxID=1440133 RepID=A0A9P6SUX9_9FUNG|nr:hypothetical protein BGZ65_007915 [Modicella reniformis]
MTSNKPATEVHSIPVDQVDFSPNISSDAGNFFQSDADLARMNARRGMVNYDKGQAIKISSKVLDMCLGINKAAPPSVVADEQEKSSSIEHTNKALAGITMYLAESGHVARKLYLETGKTMKLFQGHAGPVTRVAVYRTHLGQERLITGSWDKNIKIWDTETKECLATLKGHTDFVKALAVRTILIKDDNNNNNDTTTTKSSEKESGSSDRSNMDRRRIGHELFSASYDGTILHWDLETFQPFQGGVGGSWKGHVRGINDLGLALEEGEEGGKEYLYSAGSDGTVRKWDITRVSADKTARRLDLETKKVDTTLDHPDFVKSIALAGPYVVTGGREETIRVWSIATGKLIKEIKGHFDEVSNMAVVGTTLLTGSHDGTVRQWSLKEQDLIPPIPKDITESLSGTSQQNITVPSVSPSVAAGSKQDAAATHSRNEEATKGSMMTEEEERELAELMGSDDDDD